jgi:cob(I)alamin adenosyltransferase
MGHRISRIYTRQGDQGETSMGFGRKIRKDEMPIECIGNIDELNSLLGMVLAELQKKAQYPASVETLVHVFNWLQHDLFEVGAELSIPEYPKIFSKHVEALETKLNEFNEELKPLKEFILPAGHPAASQCFYARAYARKAERNLCRLQAESELSSHIISYINRLSDLLFVMARLINKRTGYNEVYWQNTAKHS